MFENILMTLFSLAATLFLFGVMGTYLGIKAFAPVLSAVHADDDDALVARVDALSQVRSSVRFRAVRRSIGFVIPRRAAVLHRWASSHRHFAHRL